MEKHLADSAKKFLFDINDFDEEALRRKAATARRPTFSQEEMEASRQTGFAQGRLEGLREAIDSQESQLRDLAQQVATAVEILSRDESDRLATFIDQATLITVQALSKTLPILLETLAAGQIAAFITKILEDQAKSQTVSIYVTADREAAIRAKLEEAATATGRKPNWTIQTDPTLSSLQCRVEWTGGGAEWDPKAVSDALMQTIVSHIPAHLRGAIDDESQKPHTENTSGDAS